MKLVDKIKIIIGNPSFILLVYLIITIVATLLKISIDIKSKNDSENYISSINNYIVYRNSFSHLENHTNVYGFFPKEQDDEFMYSPTFSILFAPFALLPKYTGVLIWCIFNIFILFYSIYLLRLSDTKKTFIYWFILIELITTIQNVQVNPVVCALFLLTFIAFENKNIALAALFVSLGFYIKIIGVLSGILFILYPEKIKFLAFALIWSIILFFLPMIIISFNELINYYHDWYNVIVERHVKNTDRIYISVMRMIEGIRGIWLTDKSRYIIQVSALFIFSLKLIRFNAFKSFNMRMLFLATCMIWCIIFSHASESNTYIIALTGVAIWFVIEERNYLNISLLILTFILSSIVPTDIFPRFIRENYIIPMSLKSLPFLLIWLKIEYDILFKKNNFSFERA